MSTNTALLYVAIIRFCIEARLFTDALFIHISSYHSVDLSLAIILSALVSPGCESHDSEQIQSFIQIN